MKKAGTSRVEYITGVEGFPALMGRLFSHVA
jgi:hypothetical protein